MTKQELLCFKMNPQETQKWSELCDTIRAKFALLNLPAIVYEELENCRDWRFDLEALEFVCV